MSDDLVRRLRDAHVNSPQRISGSNIFAEAAAALEAALAAMWRPIEEYDETSGERVILGIERNGRIEEVHVGYFRWAVNDDEESLWWSEQADDEILPTHFMSLPQPPKVEG